MDMIHLCGVVGALIKSEKVSKGRDDVGRKCLNVIVLVGRVFNKRGKGLAP